MIHSMEFPFRTTGKGTVIFNDLFSCGICVERLGLSRRDLDRLLRALIKSGIVIRLGLNYVIPALCTTNEIIGLIAIYANDVKNANLGANKPSGSATNSIREAIEKIIKRGLPYMVALMSYLYFEHLYWVERGKCIRGFGQCLEPYIMKDKEENVKYTLLIAFEEKFAEEVFAEFEKRIHKRLTRMFTHKKLKSVKSITKQALTLLKKKSGEFITKEVTNKLLKGDIDEVRVLRVASLLITLVAAGVQMPLEAQIRIKEEYKGFTVIELAYDNQLSKIVSYLLGKPVQDVEELFYRYLFGFRGYIHKIVGSLIDIRPRIILYPFVDALIAKLALEALHDRDVIKALINMLFPKLVKESMLKTLKQICMDIYYHTTFLNISMKKVPKRARDFIGKVMQLKQEKKNITTYNDLKTSDPDATDRVLSRLVSGGYIKATYIGPPLNELPGDCRDIGFYKDPWIQDRTKSGELKIWLIRSTGDKKLRERRRKCWGQYIQLDFTKFFNEMDIYCRNKLEQLINL